MKNSNLNKAKAEKNDEFYTRLDDIEIELSHYPAKYFKDKTIYLPCDVAIDGTKVPKSNFVKYFQINRVSLGYKKLIATSINNTKNLYILEQDGREFYGYCPEDSEYVSGDYRSEYCQKLFSNANIVVTNPPFSLFRDFVGCLEKHGVDWLIIGNQNAITYKEIFPLIKENKIRLGSSREQVRQTFFEAPDKYVPTATVLKELSRKFSNEFLENHNMCCVTGVCWFTNMNHNRINETLLLTKKYNSTDYPRYDNYNAIDVSKVTDIPCDYYEIMGVPITFLYKYNPDQFEIVGCFNNYKPETADPSFAIYGEAVSVKTTKSLFRGPVINGEAKYFRIIIRRKQQEVQ